MLGVGIGAAIHNWIPESVISAVLGTVGGALAYFGSCRLVYMIYGIGELVLAIVMFRILERDKPVVDKLNFIKV